MSLYSISKFHVHRETQYLPFKMIFFRIMDSQGTVYQSNIASLCWPPKMENNVAVMVSISWTVGSYVVSHQAATSRKSGSNTTCTPSFIGSEPAILEGKKSAPQTPRG